MKVDKADVFIAFNPVGYDKYAGSISENAMVLINSTLVETENPLHYRIPATDIAEEMGKPFVVNMVMLGALTKLLPKLHYPTVEEEIQENFSASIAGMNLEAYDKGYRTMAEELEKRKSSAAS